MCSEKVLGSLCFTIRELTDAFAILAAIAEDEVVQPAVFNMIVVDIRVRDEVYYEHR